MLDIKALLTKILQRLHYMDAGDEVLSSSIASGAYADVAVSFNKTFNTAPVVVVGFYSTSTGATFGRCSCAVHSVTTTGFTIRFFNGDTVGRQPNFRWIALPQGGGSS